MRLSRLRCRSTPSAGDRCREQITIPGVAIAMTSRLSPFLSRLRGHHIEPESRRALSRWRKTVWRAPCRGSAIVRQLERAFAGRPGACRRLTGRITTTVVRKPDTSDSGRERSQQDRRQLGSERQRKRIAPRVVAGRAVRLFIDYTVSPYKPKTRDVQRARMQSCSSGSERDLLQA